MDTDEDGSTDKLEVRNLSTNPADPVTYEITERHQRFIDEMDKHRLGVKLEIIAPEERLTQLSLDDGSDDFDFVLAKGHSPRDRAQFVALDGEPRTDQWMSNFEELLYRDVTGRKVDPWDPDTDNDGLTDGQEFLGLTIDRHTFLKDDSSESYFTNPVDPDSDNDGYWDGWIGVYGVNRSDNVVLYRSHLREDGDGSNGDDGIQQSEMVNEQLGFHDVTNTAASGGNPFSRNGSSYHSNVHIGELYWDRHPDDDGDTPSPSVRLEIDFDNNSVQALRNASWRRNVSANYAMYGINVTFLTTDSHQDPIPQRQLEAILGAAEYNDGFNWDDIREVGDDDTFWDHPDHRYTLITTQAENVPGERYLFPGQTGVRLGNRNAIFSHGVILDVGTYPPSTLSRDQQIRSIAQSTQVHEIGHLLGIGEADDGPNGGEVYSGDPNDPTPENVSVANTQVDDWSVMNNGGTVNEYASPGGANFFPFSIEELLTVEA